MFLPYESYNESDDKSDNDSDNKSNIISNQEQILDIRHEYSGTGMQKPNYLYAILFKYSFKLILWLNGMFYRHKKGSPSPNLMITNKILYYITRVSYSNTIKCHRQPMLGLLSPLLPNTALYSFNLTHTRGWKISTEGNYNNHSIQILYIHGGGCISGDWAGFKGFCSKISSEMGAAEVYFTNYRIIPDWTLKDAVDDIIETYKFMVERSPAKKIVLMGIFS